MKENNRPTFRPRNVDHSKPMQLIRDLGEFYRKEDSSSLNWVKDLPGDANFESKSILEGEIKKIFELFDKKKTIVIPKVEESEKAAAAQYTSEGKFTTHSVSYKQSEFVRPNNYIVYSEKNRLEPKGKDYEASVIDLNFLKFENNFISSEELEKIVSALENDINKGEMIPNERVKEIILSIIPPDKKQHIDKIIRFWQTRREEYKKSLVRKFWKDQKHNDKYLATTFRRREREKMKTRRNKRNEYESLKKLKEIRESSKKYLVDIISAMKERELTKRNIIILQQMEFEAEANLYRCDKITVEDKFRDFIKTLPKPSKPLSFISPIKPDERDKENEPKKHKETIMTKSDLIQVTNIERENTNSSLTMLSDIQKKIPRPVRPQRIQKIDKVPQGVVSQVVIKPSEEKKTPSEYVLKHRIRINKMNNLVIDRYIQSANSFSPFDDDFNKLINKFKVYNEDYVYNRKKTGDFDTMYEDYLKGRYNVLVVSDSEDDQYSVSTQVRSFSSSFKQFLKHKRSHPEISGV